jgi:hypothetical protein
MASDPLNLDAAGEWSGLWWLPDDPNQQVPGILRYSPEDGLALSLMFRVVAREPSVHE